MHTSTYTHAHTHTLIHIHIPILAYTPQIRINTCIYTCTHTYMPTCTHIHTHGHTCTPTLIYKYIHRHTHTLTHPSSSDQGKPEACHHTCQGRSPKHQQHPPRGNNTGKIAYGPSSPHSPSFAALLLLESHP